MIKDSFLFLDAKSDRFNLIHEHNQTSAVQINQEKATF